MVVIWPICASSSWVLVKLGAWIYCSTGENIFDTPAFKPSTDELVLVMRVLPFWKYRLVIFCENCSTQANTVESSIFIMPADEATRHDRPVSFRGFWHLWDLRSVECSIGLHCKRLCALKAEM